MRTGEFWEAETSSAIPVQTTEEATCKLTAEKGTKPYG